MFRDWFKSAERRQMEALVAEYRFQLLTLDMTYHNVKMVKEVRQYVKGQRDQLQSLLYDLEECLDLPHDRNKLPSAVKEQKLLSGFHTE